MTAKVDVHAHYLPPDYREALLAHGHAAPDGFPVLPEWSPQAHLAMMDRLGIGTSMLSVSSPGVAFGDDPARWARSVNDAGAAAVREHPGRFGLLASLPLPDVEAAIAEVARALDVLGADGIVLMSNVGGTYLGDPSFAPLLAELDRRRAVVLIHPTSPCGWEGTALGHPRPVLEFLMDTTRNIADLVLTGALTRNPGIRIIVPHAGAALPLVADRLAGFAGVFGLGGHEPGEIDVVGTLQRLFYDLAGFPFPRGLPALLALVSVEQILYGSDFPFTPLPPIEATAAQLAASDLIDDERLRANALGLFPRLAATN